MYYPSEAAQQPGLTMKAVNTWIGREQTVMLAGRTSSHRLRLACAVHQAHRGAHDAAWGRCYRGNA